MKANDAGKRLIAHKGVLFQVAFFFLVSVMMAATVTYYTQQAITESSVRRSTEAGGAAIAQEASEAVKESPAWEWLLRYWRDHSEEMDIEYDVDYVTGEKTEAKVRLLAEHQPDFQPRYAEEAEAAALPAEDQKLFAEIMYSWTITRMNEINEIYRVQFLFCVLTDSECRDQFFLLSAGQEGMARGRTYMQVYTLGTRVSVADSPMQQEAMRGALETQARLIYTGPYANYYGKIGELDGQHLLVGMTYDLTRIRSQIHSQMLASVRWAIGYQLVLSLLLVSLILLFVLRPFRRVQQNIRLYANTKDSAAVAKNLAGIASGTDEVGLLSRDFIDMTREMDEYVHRISAITADRERIGAELALAARIQSSALPGVFPPFPDRTEFDIFASMRPAKEVGGDFYDFFLADEDHLVLTIADVSGKGVPAALFMMVSMLLLHEKGLEIKSPAEILRRANDQICAHNPEEMFVTVWLGILEISTGRLTAASAGHEYPMLKRAKERFEMVHDKHGFVVGAMEGVRFTDYEMQLEPGDKLFLYTDGLPEATDAQDQLFGTDRVVTALREAEGGTPREILEHIHRRAAEFAGEAPQFDDLTMMCLEYKGTKGALAEDE